MVEASVLLNALALFIPAMIGVIGSYGLYRKRQRDSENNLREAFIAELEGTEYLEKWPDTDYTVPAYNFLSMSVYETNADKLAHLTREEVTAVVQFYTRAKSVKDLMRLHSEILVRTQGGFSSDTGLSKRKATLRSGIDKLELARLRALSHLEAQRGKETVPREGDSLDSLGERIQSNRAILRDYDFVEEDKQGQWRISEKGAQFFSGDLLLTGLPRQRDVLDRNKHPTRRKLERLWRWLQKHLFSRHP